MKVVLDADGYLNIYDGGELLLGLSPDSVNKTMRRAEEQMHSYFTNIGGKRNAAKLAYRVMRILYAGEAGEYDVDG